MKTERIKVTDLHTLQMEKQRLQMQIDYTEEQIVDRVSGFVSDLPGQLVARILPFGLGRKPGTIKGMNRVREFIGANFLGGKPGTTGGEIIKTVFPLAKAFVTSALSGMLKKKKS